LSNNATIPKSAVFSRSPKIASCPEEQELGDGGGVGVERFGYAHDVGFVDAGVQVM
jgi:hypothetical protein